jgi:predicted amidohydrolase
VIFPETTFSGFIPQEALSWTSRHADSTLSAMRETARSLQVDILYGSWIPTGEGRVMNCGVLIRHADDEVAVVGKRHLFPLEDEHLYVAEGHQNLLVELSCGRKIGVAICFDLRFPEMYWQHGTDVEAIVTIANWPSSRSDHWRCLLQARAIENQAFSVGVNRSGGSANGVSYLGDNYVFDAEGKSANLIDLMPNLSIALLDFDSVASARAKFPFLASR